MVWLEHRSPSRITKSNRPEISKVCSKQIRALAFGPLGTVSRVQGNSGFKVCVSAACHLGLSAADWLRVLEGCVQGFRAWTESSLVLRVVAFQDVSVLDSTSWFKDFGF